MKRALIVAVFATLCLGLGACGDRGSNGTDDSADGGSSGSPTPEGATGHTGAKSPKELMDRMEAMMKSKDEMAFLKMVELIHPDEQPALAITFSLMPVMMASMAAAFAPEEKKGELTAVAKEAEELLKRHGLDEEAVKGAQNDPSADKLTDEQKFEKFNALAKGVDHMALLRDAMMLMKKLGDGDTETTFDAEAFEQARASMKVEGDRATFMDPDGSKDDVILVKAEDGLWYISALQSGLFDRGM